MTVDKLPAPPARNGPIEVVLFDAVGTLLAPDPPAAAAYHAAGLRHGASLSPDEVAARFRAAFARSEVAGPAQGDGRTDETRERLRWRSVVGEVFRELDDPEPLFDELWTHFAEPRHWRLYDDAAAIVTRLASRGVRLAIASNFDSRLRGLCQAIAPLTNIESIYISSEVGYRKPHVEFFAAIERLLGIAPERLLLVGDSPTNDFHAARAAGWQALLLDRADEHTEVAAEYKLRSLEELVSRV